MYRLLGLDELLPRSRYRASHDALFHVVMARIANPDSKRGSVRRLEEDFGVSLPLEKVYRMMDQLDATVIKRLRTRVGEASRSLLPEPVAILFFDCTTLYFESAVEDELRQHGFSKDGKHKDSQVLLALMVTREGLPIGYEVFPGATYEGHSLVPVLQDMQRRHQVERTVCVADRGMLSADNLDAMDKIGGEYVVGARLRKLPLALLRQILDPDAYAPLEGSENRRVGEWEYKGRRLIVVFCPVRARKDAHERRHQVEPVLDKLARSDNPKELLSNHGAKRFNRRRGRSPAHGEPGEDRRGRAMGRARRRHHQSARRERHRGDVPLPRALAGRGELPDHQARPSGCAPSGTGTRTGSAPTSPSPSWPSPASATWRTASPSRNGGCPRRSSAPPSSTANAPSCAAGNRATATSSPRNRHRQRNRSTRPWGCP